jgi:hypothetical protein
MKNLASDKRYITKKMSIADKKSFYNIGLGFDVVIKPFFLVSETFSQ